MGSLILPSGAHAVEDVPAGSKIIIENTTFHVEQQHWLLSDSEMENILVAYRDAQYCAGRLEACREGSLGKEPRPTIWDRPIGKAALVTLGILAGGSLVWAGSRL